MEEWQRDQLKALRHSRRRYLACLQACRAMQADVFVKARRLLGLDPEQMAEMLDIDGPRLVEIECGVRRPATARNFEVLLRAIERAGCEA